MNMKLEVVIVPVSDVDRAKAFYEKLGFRFDIDIVNENFRGIQFTPPGSEASIIFGKGVTSAQPGSADLVLAVDNVDAAREDLIARGVNVSEVFHYAGGPLNNAVENPRVAGRDPEGRSYFSFVSFKDPDGNGWLLQEITTRLPGRIDSAATTFNSVSDLSSALRGAEAAHGEHEKRTGQRDANWPDWYAKYMVAEQAGTELPQ
jgi:catechol 2,3-dioxygenase-like lactoylglutathione lyase family enzyme